MNLKNKISLVLVGFTIWAVATLVFQKFGSYFFERSALEYWINVIGTGVVYAVVSVGLMKWWQIEPKHWLKGAICIALPGMLGEIPVLVNFSAWMSNMHPETAGRYAAFLFGGYASLLGFAWFMSAKASLRLMTDSQ